MDCRIATLRVRTGRKIPAARVVQCLENAFRTASFPGMSSGAFVVVRSIALRIGTDSMSFVSASRILDQSVRDLVRHAVPAWSAAAAYAPAVWFRDNLDPPALLALRLVLGRRAAEWFWKSAVIGWRSDFSTTVGLRYLAKAAGRLQPARPAMVRMLATLMDAGRLDALLEVLSREDGGELLALFGLSIEMMDRNPAWHAGGMFSFLPELSAAWQRLVLRWAARWGERDSRTLWLMAVALWMHHPSAMETLLNHSSFPSAAMTLRAKAHTDPPGTFQGQGASHDLSTAPKPNKKTMSPEPAEPWRFRAATGDVQGEQNRQEVSFPKNLARRDTLRPEQSGKALGNLWKWVSESFPLVPVFRCPWTVPRAAETAAIVMRNIGDEADKRTAFGIVPSRNEKQFAAYPNPVGRIPSEASFHPRHGHKETRTPMRVEKTGRECASGLAQEEKIEEGFKGSPFAAPVSGHTSDAVTDTPPFGAVDPALGPAEPPHGASHILSSPKGMLALQRDAQSIGVGSSGAPNPGLAFLSEGQWSSFAGFLFLLGLFRPLSLDELFCQHSYFAAMAAGPRFLQYMAGVVPLPMDDPHHQIMAKALPFRQQDGSGTSSHRSPTVSSVFSCRPDDASWGQTVSIQSPIGTQPVPLFEPPASWRRLLAEEPRTRRRLGLQLLETRNGVRLLTDRTQRLVFGVSIGRGKLAACNGWVPMAESQGLADRILEGLFRAARLAVFLFLWRREAMTFRQMVQRPGRMRIGPTHVDVFFSLDQLDVRLRRLGLDVNPGWVPWLTRVVSFHYGD